MYIAYVTKSQTARAREILVLEYVLRYEGDKVKRVGGGYRLKDHDSLAISDKGFYWHSTGEGGKTALDFLISVWKWDFVSAVCHLIGEAPFEKGDRVSVEKQSSPPPKKPIATEMPKTPPQDEQQYIALPRRNKDNYNVIAYLQNRGIDRNVIMDCINRGVLYESVLYHNAVFLGKDENNKTRCAAMRGTKGDFKCDAEGSNKKYGFVVPPKDPGSTSVMLMESPIDCLSHQTLCRRGDIPSFDGWRLSLGGTSDIALIGFLERFPSINHCIIATDNDEAGNAFAERVAKKINMPTERVQPLQGKDWNDCLLLVQQASRRREHANGYTSHSRQDEPDL